MTDDRITPPECKFCRAMQINEICAAAAACDTNLTRKHSAAIVTRTFVKGRSGPQGSSTDYRYRGCGYALNYCPECGKPMRGKGWAAETEGDNERGE